MQTGLNLKMNTQTGQIYLGNKCLHKDDKGYYTISIDKIQGMKMQTRHSITDVNQIKAINEFLN